ncbi:FAD-binding protein [Fibrella forsythiae]|uniref:FAD-binding protein n=1 Tax=Fibrella forsythiae TaxID=2817061 RepID=A0ABS3JJ80_9BACT|nr:FAD-binding protein [Fibrella forsythiae]MBO0950066.1 FAD-binding protein [Fibrella forsythiae]
MKRNEFLKTSSMLVAGSMFSPLISCTSQAKNVRKNWAGNYQYQAPEYYEPKTVDELLTVMKRAGKRKALGSCHCFNDIADSPLAQISTKNFNKLLSIDEQAMTVTVEAGARYGQFAPELDKKGYALHNLASLPHISVAGACATATHGSGVKNGNLSSAVSGLELVTAKGDVVNLTRANDAQLFNGAVVGLGALGIITKMTLDIQKTYQVRQDLFQDLPLQSLLDHFEEILASGYSVSLFTDWQDKKISQVWVKRKVEADTKSMGPDLFGAKAATKNLHPITKLSAENCTEQMGVPGPWYERLPHFKMGFTPSSGEELQSEYFVPKMHAVEAFQALEKMGSIIYPQLMISEIRTIAADSFWMSPCRNQDSVAFHFTWKQNWEEVSKILPQIEAELAPFNARPHWGKLFKVDPKVLKERYEMLPEFLQLARMYDPQGHFRNKFLDLNIYVR